MFFNLGNLLVTRDEAVRADAIVMLIGKIGDRSLLTIDLYKNGYSDKIVLVKNFDTQATMLKNAGYTVNSETDRILHVFSQAGIPDSAVILLDYNSKNTVDEAKAIAEWCASSDNIKSLLLVTSSYHSSRAKSIFATVFKKRELLISLHCPFNKFSSYSNKNWFLTPSDIDSTFSETCKWIMFWCWTRWNI
jgi:uncharacterized SAM-binding protein YcdF (DUF218 family)